MTTREFLTKFVIKSEGHEVLDNVEHKLDQIKERLELFAAAEITEKIFELTERFAHFAEELHVASQNAGITAEELQRLSFAAAQSGVSQDEMSTSLARLSRNLYEAKNGSVTAQLAFQRVGVNAAQLEGFKNSKDALLALSDRFKSIQDPIQKAALAQELLGRGGSRLVGFLSKGSGAIGQLGSEAEKLGAVISDKQVEALVNLEHAFMRVFAVARAFGATMASYLAPEVQEAVKSFLAFYQANRKVIDVNAKSFIGDLAYAFGFLWGIVSRVAQAFFDFAATHELLARRVAEVVTGLIALTGVIYLGERAWNVLSGALEILGTVFGGIIGQIGLITVGFHDLVALFRGEKTWTQSFIEWLGVAEQVQDVMFAIFDVVSDLLDLDFSKLGKDLLGDLKGIGDFTGISKLFGGASNASDNLDSAQALGGVGSSGLAALGSQQPQAPGSSVGNYSINAPITVNVPQGTDNRAVGESVKQGVRDHLDRVQREAARSLRGAVAR